MRYVQYISGLLLTLLTTGAFAGQSLGQSLGTALGTALGQSLGTQLGTALPLVSGGFFAVALMSLVGGVYVARCKRNKK